MLSEEKIKKMIRLSDYENGQGNTDLRRVRYIKMDYIRLQVLKTIISVVVAFLLFALLLALYRMKYVLENALMLPWKQFALYGGIGILIVGTFSVIATVKLARKRYEESALRAREYYSTLQELMELYKKEEQGQEDEFS